MIANKKEESSNIKTVYQTIFACGNIAATRASEEKGILPIKIAAEIVAHNILSMTCMLNSMQ